MSQSIAGDIQAPQKNTIDAKLLEKRLHGSVELADFDYHLDEFPGQTPFIKEHIYNHLLRENESVWLGEVPKSCLKTLGKNEIDAFFRNPNEEHQRLMTKLSWLATEFFTKGFQTYFGAHYNPIMKRNVYHPGGGRCLIHHWFDPSDTIKMFYFNTLGQQYPWLESMQKLQYQDIRDMNYDITWVADHTTFIPHLFYVSTDAPLTTRQGVEKFTDIFQQRLSQFSFQTNYKVPNHLNKYVSKHAPMIKMKTHTDENFYKALLVVMNRLPYKTKDFIIHY